MQFAIFLFLLFFDRAIPEIENKNLNKRMRMFLYILDLYCFNWSKIFKFKIKNLKHIRPLYYYFYYYAILMIIIWFIYGFLSFNLLYRRNNKKI